MRRKDICRFLGEADRRSHTILLALKIVEKVTVQSTKTAFYTQQHHR